MKNCNMILTDKQQKYQHYDPEKFMNMNILQVKKYYLLIKEDKLSLLIISYVYLFPFRKSFRKIKKNN